MPRKKREEDEELELNKDELNDEDEDLEDEEEDDSFGGDEDEEPEAEPSDDDLKHMKDLEEFDDIIEKRSAGKGRKASSAWNISSCHGGDNCDGS